MIVSLIFDTIQLQIFIVTGFLNNIMLIRPKNVCIFFEITPKLLQNKINVTKVAKIIKNKSILSI